MTVIFEQLSRDYLAQLTRDAAHANRAKRARRARRAA